MPEHGSDLVFFAEDSNEPPPNDTIQLRSFCTLYLRIAMETRDYDHVTEIRQALIDEGLRVVESV